MVTTMHEAQVNEDLNKCGVTRFVRENSTLQITFGNEKVVIFDIHPKGVFKTIENLKASAKNEKIDAVTISKVVFVLLSEQNDYVKFCKGHSRVDDHKDSSTVQQECAIDASKELDPYVPDKEYSEYVIRTVKKTVKQEDVLIRQILYSALSSASDNPINPGIIAPTSEGKTYPVIRTMHYFPQQNVWNVGQMSTKALVRQNGVLIDNKSHLIGHEVKELRKQIAILGNNKDDKATKADLKQELNELLENSKTLIDLSGMVLLFFEPPDKDLWNLLKPILSHDKLEIEFPYVEKTQIEGYMTKKVVVRGWPACIFCSAKDESNWSGWPEILSRFIITSPNMNKTKYLESNMLIAQTQSLPHFVQKRVIVSPKDEEIAKKCICYLLDRIANFFSNNKINQPHGLDSKQDEGAAEQQEEAQPVWIPFGNILGEVLKSEKGTDNRTVKRLFAFIKMISLAKAELRQKLIYNQTEKLVVASLEDLTEALYITQNVSGIPAYKLKFYKQSFLPLCRSKQEKDKSPDGNKEEAIIGVTSKQLSDFIKLETGKVMNPENIRKNFLDELENHDYIGSVKSVIDGRQKVYYSIIDLDSDDEYEDDKGKINKLWNEDKIHNFLQHSLITMPKNCIDIPENWLIFEILGIAKYGIDLDNFRGCIADELNYNNKNIQLLDKNGNRLTVKQFITQYEKHTSLIPYFRRSKINTFYNKTFGYMIHIGENWQEEYEKLWNQDIFHNFRNFELEHNKLSQRQERNEKPSPIVSVDVFFDPSIDYQRLPPHTVGQSPCFLIIVKDGEGLYHCKLHCSQGYESTDLDTIEYHCKTQDPDKHKAEILRLLKEKEKEETAATAAINNNNNILYSQIILRNSLNNQQRSR